VKYLNNNNNNQGGKFNLKEGKLNFNMLSTHSTKQKRTKFLLIKSTYKKKVKQDQ
jgi:hypothetical protein